MIFVDEHIFGKVSVKNDLKNHLLKIFVLLVNSCYLEN